MLLKWNIIILLLIIINIWITAQTSFFDDYHDYQEIMKILKVVQDRSNLLSIKYIGWTEQGNVLTAAKISTNHTENKPIILIDAGLNPKEWISITTALYILNELLKPENRDMLKYIDWHVLPLMNPDGYIFTRKNNRYWRKNRSKYNGYCYGVDLDRNFNFHWLEADANGYTCFQHYAGKYPFSEKETIAFKNYVTQNRKMITLYVSLHSFGNIIAYPNSYANIPPSNNEELYDLGKMVAEKILTLRKTKYFVGMAHEIMYPASGDSTDWMKNVLNIPLVYKIMLPRGGPTGYDPDRRLIKIIGKEMFFGFKIFQKYVENMTKPFPEKTIKKN